MSEQAKSPLQRLKILYLYKILTEYTDEAHALSMPDIITKLEFYGITAARKALYEDIEALKLYGLDIVDGRGRGADYRVVSREFELAELKLLADAVSSSKFLTEKKSRDLTNKIASLCSVHEAKNLRRQIFVSGRVKSINEKIYVNVDSIHNAISAGKKISFRYYAYDRDKRKVYRDGKRICTPYSLVWDDEKYYMVAYCEKRDAIINFRVDRMEAVEMLSSPARLLPVGFNLPEYLGSTFSMFAGEAREVKLMFHNSLVNSVIDRFGKDIKLVPYGDDYFTIHAKVKVQPPFFGWLFQFGDKATVMEPADVVDEYKKMLQNALNALSSSQ